MEISLINMPFAPRPFIRRSVSVGGMPSFIHPSFSDGGMPHFLSHVTKVYYFAPC